MIRKQPARYERIADYLKGLIAEAEPGDRLPSEAELCERFDVSRMTASSETLEWDEVQPDSDDQEDGPLERTETRYAASRYTFRAILREPEEDR